MRINCFRKPLQYEIYIYMCNYIIIGAIADQKLGLPIVFIPLASLNDSQPCCRTTRAREVEEGWCADITNSCRVPRREFVSIGRLMKPLVHIIQ